MGSAAFLTLIKSRDALQWKKHDEKQSSHELKAGVWGVGGRAETNRQLLTNSCTEHSTDREGERAGGGYKKKERTLATKMESPHFSTVWKYGPHFMIQFPLPPFFPPSLTTPFPTKPLALFCSCSPVIKAC